MSRNQDLANALERVGKIIAADQGVEVQVRGVAAYCTENRVVVIPSIDTYEWLGRDNAESMLAGLLDHETGHARDSDFTYVKLASKRGEAFKHLLNALEDGYVEMRQGNRYRGCAQNLAKKNTWFWEQDTGDGRGKSLAARIKKAENLWEAFLLALTMVVRPFGGRTIADVRKLNKEVAEMLAECEHDWRGIAKLADKARASGEVYAIAERIFARFDKHARGGTAPKEDEPPKAKKQPKAKPDPEAKGDEEGEEGDESAGGSGDEEGEEGEEGDESAGGSGDDEGEEGDESAGGSGDDEGEDGDDEGAATPRSRTLDLDRWTPLGRPLTPEDRINTIIRSVFEQSSALQPYTVFSHEFDLLRDFSSEDLSAQSAAYEAVEAKTRLAADALVLAFEAAFRARHATHMVAGADEGEIDPHMLARYTVGAEQPDTIFMQPVAGDSREVAVSILVDCSGSMSGRAELAQQTACAMSRALAIVGIQHEVLGFTCADSSNAGTRDHDWIDTKETREAAALLFRQMRAALLEAQARGTDVTRFARELPHHKPGSYISKEELETTTLQTAFHAIFKSFGNDDARGLARIAGIHNNLDGEGLLFAARRIAERSETRRIMFVLSDGAPAGPTNHEQGVRHLHDCVKAVTEAGIEVYGIGIASRAVSIFYPRFWVVDDLDSLIEVAVTSMTEVITENRTEREWVSL